MLSSTFLSYGLTVPRLVLGAYFVPIGTSRITILQLDFWEPDLLAFNNTSGEYLLNVPKIPGLHTQRTI